LLVTISAGNAEYVGIFGSNDPGLLKSK